jgi:hypothetical protein
MDRRQFLAAAGATGAAGLAGCLSLFETRSARFPPVADHRPNAVYVPTHVEGMTMEGMATSGRLRAAFMYSYPHRFWNVTSGSEETTVEKTGIEDGDAVHAMVALWDRETGVYLPDTGLSLELSQDGEPLGPEVIYPMLSPQMGFHYGGNFPLEGDGTYVAEVSVGGTATRRTGAFRGQFGDPATMRIEFTYSREERENLSIRTFDDRAGERGTVAPMGMAALPDPALPGPDALPGVPVGTARTGDDIAFVGMALDAPPAGLGSEGDGYLAVSARTRYNRMLLPMMALRATVERGGETVYDGRLTPTLDPDLHYHYGATAPVRSDDDVTVTVETPPQVARHEGYETAFLERSSVTLS